MNAYRRAALVARTVELLERYYASLHDHPAGTVATVGEFVRVACDDCDDFLGLPPGHRAELASLWRRLEAAERALVRSLVATTLGLPR